MRTQRSIGFGVRLGTTDVSRPSTSARAALLKLTFIIDLGKMPKKVNIVKFQTLFTQGCSLHKKVQVHNLFPKKSDLFQPPVGRRPTEQVNNRTPLRSESYAGQAGVV
jgi:hypothetical protein